MTPREIRRAAGRSQIVVAVAARVSEPTLRLYEANPGAVTMERRARLDAVYAALHEETRSGAIRALPGP